MDARRPPRLKRTVDARPAFKPPSARMVWWPCHTSPASPDISWVAKESLLQGALAPRLQILPPMSPPGSTPLAIVGHLNDAKGRERFSSLLGPHLPSEQGDL